MSDILTRIDSAIPSSPAPFPVKANPAGIRALRNILGCAGFYNPGNRAEDNVVISMGEVLDVSEGLDKRERDLICTWVRDNATLLAEKAKAVVAAAEEQVALLCSE